MCSTCSSSAVYTRLIERQIRWPAAAERRQTDRERGRRREGCEEMYSAVQQLQQHQALALTHRATVSQVYYTLAAFTPSVPLSVSLSASMCACQRPYHHYVMTWWRRMTWQLTSRLHNAQSLLQRCLSRLVAINKPNHVTSEFLSITNYA